MEKKTPAQAHMDLMHAMGIRTPASQFKNLLHRDLPDLTDLSSFLNVAEVSFDADQVTHT